MSTTTPTPYVLHYVSADGPGPDATWSVYREKYASVDSDEPIDGSSEHISTHATEVEARAESERLQVEARLKYRLEYLRGEIRAERISYGELAELADLADKIEPSDVELLQWAGVAEDVQPELPLPSQRFQRGIVIASVWQNDDRKHGPIFALILLLHDEPPYFEVFEITWHPIYKWSVNEGTRVRHYNIVPAVDDYKDRGGDY